MDIVFVVGASDYSQPSVASALEELFGLAGGVQSIVRRDERVLLKVNMVDAVPADKHATTHPEVVRALIRMLQANGAVVAVGDSPGIASTRKAAEKCGIAAVCAQEGVELLDFAQGIEVRLPLGRVVKKLFVAKCVDEYDKIISVAKMKTHTFMGTTGAVKNMFGIVPGINKAKWHFRMQNQDSFAKLLMDICSYKPPVFSIIDGITGMEGNGPRNGQAHHAGMLLGGANPYAVDAVMTTKMGFDVSRSPLIAAAIAEQIVPGLSNIVVAGSAAQRVCDFEAAKSYKTVSDAYPQWLTKLLRLLLTPRPRVRGKKCIGCAECAKICPAQAIVMSDKKAVIDAKQCIRCFCCQEFCPADAIAVRKF